MLLSLLMRQPEALPSILRQTPLWVWGLLTGLIALGVSQLFRRRVSVTRVALLPISMTGLSAYSLASAIGASGQVVFILVLWLAAAVLSTRLALVWRDTPPPGTHFDAGHRTFDLPGSAVPLMIILAIFFTKYGVGIELAMQSGLAQDLSFAYTLAAVYGAFNGLLAARSLRLWHLTRSARATAASTPAFPA